MRANLEIICPDMGHKSEYYTYLFHDYIRSCLKKQPPESRVMLNKWLRLEHASNTTRFAEQFNFRLQPDIMKYFNPMFKRCQY